MYVFLSIPGKPSILDHKKTAVYLIMLMMDNILYTCVSLIKSNTLSWVVIHLHVKS